MKLTVEEEARLQKILEPIRNNKRVQEMKKYIQHGRISTYDHVIAVTRASYWINSRLRLGADEKLLTRGAFLHDFYLYDWHEGDAGNGLHGFSHPRTAAKNAKRIFHINRKEEEIISCHMWPLTFTRLPRSKEAWIVCLMDKYVATKETFFRWRTPRVN